MAVTVGPLTVARVTMMLHMGRMNQGTNERTNGWTKWMDDGGAGEDRMALRRLACLNKLGVRKVRSCATYATRGAIRWMVWYNGGLNESYGIAMRGASA